MDPLKSMVPIAASGMHAQGERLKVVAENVANADFDRRHRPAPIPTSARPSPSRR